MNKVKIFLVMLLSFTILCGCETEEECLLQVGDGIRIELREEKTQQPITKGHFTGFVRCDDYTDSLRHWIRQDTSITPFPMLLHAYVHNIGTYSAFIEMDGYEPWTKENIQIKREKCRFGSVNITAFLKKK